MSRNTPYLIVFALVLLLGSGVYWLTCSWLDSEPAARIMRSRAEATREETRPEPPQTPVEPAAEPAPAAPVKPAAPHPAQAGTGSASKPAPIIRMISSETLPELDESDTAIHEGLGGAVEAGALELLFYPDQWIRRFVATLDSLTRKKLPNKLRCARPLGDEFLTIGDDQTLMLDPANRLRYRIFAGLVESIDTRRLVALYKRYYPLFQTAYRELGDSPEQFNGRLVDVIDHLLAAPQVTGDIRLVRAEKLYKFADPRLEALSSGHKLMVRLGNDNARRVKTKLLELRTALVDGNPA